MGSFYTNITARTGDLDRVATAVREVRRTALIAPPAGGAVVVFDQASEGQDVEVLKALAAHLSRACACSTIAVMNHDDDVLIYFLYDRGALKDEYNSAPGYFDPDGAADDPPSGGDVKRLLSVLGGQGSAAALDRILHTSAGDDDAFAFATDRHRELAVALGLPEFAAGAGYDYLEAGEIPEGVDVDALVRV